MPTRDNPKTNISVPNPSMGKNSTEFWLTVFTGFVMLANGTELLNIPWDQFVIWMGANGIYTGARTLNKLAVVKANGKT